MTVTGLGPHRDFTAQLDPSGRTVIAGPSESGKTFLLEAITFCLWGRAHGGKLQPEAISDGMNKATVEILLDSGRLLRRSVTATTQRRSITIGEDTQTYTTESAFAEGLGDLGRDVDVLHLVIAPFQWVEMVQGNARPFRDLLTRILPEMDVAAEVKTLVEAQGFVLEDGEAELGEKEVMGLRSKARKDRDEALGRQQASQERMATLATMEPAAPPGGSDEDRTALLEAAAAWADHDRQSGGGDKHAVAAEAARVWDQRIAALGAEPAWDPAFDGAEGRFQRAQLAANQATQVYQQAYGQHQTALTQMQQFQGMDPSVCPTCQRPGWATGVQYLQQLQTFQNQLKLSFDQATANFQAAKAELDAATATASGAREAELRRKGWADTKRSLGARPVVPAAPAGAPAPPAMPRPDSEEVAEAQAALRASASYAGAHQQWKANWDAAVAATDKETARHDAAGKVYDRLSALLDAVRIAPSTVAARQALSLGDMGPVSLEFGDNPAVKVLIDGRPWWLASRGRQVVADMWLRGAIRRVLDKEWLPIVVDNVQDVGGQPLPELTGPVVLLQTTDGKGISVRRK